MLFQGDAVKCLSCHVEKDLSVLEEYPYPEDDRLSEGMHEPLLCIEVQPNIPGDGYRMAIFCNECFHRLHVSRGIDAWIGQECWESLEPKTPFIGLPMVKCSGGSAIYSPSAYDDRG